MQKKNGNKPNYHRNTGNKTARLQSKKAAKKVTKISLDNYRYESEREIYNDYYDDLQRDHKRRSAAAIVAAVALMAVVFAIVIVGLTLLRPKEQHYDLVQADTTQAEEADTTQAVIEDSDAPVIYGVMPLVTYAGHSVSYKSSVYVSDDNDPNPTLEIENDEVDLSTPGSYVVAYVARDKDLNVTREYTTLTVLEGEELISEEEIYAFADTILDALITDDLTDAEKCLKVYEYLHAIGYVDKVHSEDWMQNAYWMMKRREGDCFCYYSAARLLLTRLGYDVMEVRNNNNYVHYWCLVSIDGGETWWHFDACCWSWGEDGILCLVSDNYLTNFTKRHMTSDGRLIHAWDRTNYPATPEEDFWTDEERSVIYESGLIELFPEYEPDADIWNTSDGWDDYYNRFGYDYYTDYTYGTEYSDYYNGTENYDQTGEYGAAEYNPEAPDYSSDTPPAYDYSQDDFGQNLDADASYSDNWNEGGGNIVEGDFLESEEIY